MTARSFWIVRAGREAKYVGDFEEVGVAGLGWAPVGPKIDGVSKEDLIRRVRSAYPSESDGAAKNGASQLLRWRDEVSVGDGVATYDRDRRRYLVGEIVSDLRWDDAALPALPRVREVKWFGHVARDGLTEPVRRSLNSMLTLTKARDDVAAELRTKAVPLDGPLGETFDGGDPPTPAPALIGPNVDGGDATADDAAEIAEFGQEFTDRADEAIEEQIVQLSPDQMEHLAAGLLRGMGYRTTVSPTGADRGVDVFASPDGLGLEEPRVFVEVKHRRNTAMGAPELRGFLGGRSAGDRCLYVSTGGFTHEARYEADRSTIPLRLLGLKDLRKLAVDLYPKLDEQTRALIPLRRVYVPVH